MSTKKSIAKSHNKRTRIILFAILTTFFAMLDIISKIIVNNNMRVGESIEVIENFFHITHLRNYGIIFGLYNNVVEIFTVVSILGVFVILGFFYSIYKSISRISLVRLYGLTMIIGGALGNTFDRFYRGFVIDFIDFVGIWQYPFNVADVFINVGLALLIIDAFLPEKEEN